MSTQRGFRLPGLPAMQTAATKLAVGLVAGSILFALFRQSFGEWLVLVPALVLRSFALWQPLTYAFIENSPMGVIFGALILWSIGGALEQTWGSRRLVLFALGVTALSGALTVALSILVEALQAMPFFGGTVMTSALWVAYGLSYGQRQTNFWGMAVTGNVLALIGVGFIFLNGAFGSWLAIIPSALGALLSFGYVRGATPSMLLLRVQSWRLHRQLKGRSKHLRVIGKDRNTPNDSDKFLH